jgi:hypothetical protein
LSGETAVSPRRALSLIVYFEREEEVVGMYSDAGSSESSFAISVESLRATLAVIVEAEVFGVVVSLV